MHQTYYFCPQLKAAGHSCSSTFVLDTFQLSKHVLMLHPLGQRMKRGYVFAFSIFVG
jgi:hypothetical protein